MLRTLFKKLHARRLGWSISAWISLPLGLLLAAGCATQLGGPASGAFSGPYSDAEAMQVAEAMMQSSFNARGQAGLDRLKQLRSTIPAVTHVDYSARIQTVDDTRNPRLHALLKLWEQATGCAVLVNTSFNVRGEPIVCTPDDAYRCFVNTSMDYLVIGNFLLERFAQPQQPVATTFERVPD